MSKQNLPAVGRLIKGSLGGAWRGRWLYAGLVAVVVLPVNLLLLATGGNEDATIRAYLALAQVIMNLALIWAVIRRVEGERAGIAQAYYDGTASLVRFLLASLVIALLVFFALLGLMLFLLGNDLMFTPLPELLLLGVLALLWSGPFLYLLTRLLFAPYAVVARGMRPVAAHKDSFARTRRAFWPLALRLFVLALLVILAAVPPVLIGFALAFAGFPVLGQAIAQVLLALIILPLAHEYLYRLYLGLK